MTDNNWTQTTSEYLESRQRKREEIEMKSKLSPTELEILELEDKLKQLKEKQEKENKLNSDEISTLDKLKDMNYLNVSDYNLSEYEMGKLASVIDDTKIKTNQNPSYLITPSMYFSSYDYEDLQNILLNVFNQATSHNCEIDFTGILNKNTVMVSEGLWVEFEE